VGVPRPDGGRDAGLQLPAAAQARLDLAQADIQMSGISYNPGGWALAAEADTSTSFSLPPRDGSGNMLHDFDNLVAYECALPNGTEHDLPDGVDISIAFNTSEDKKAGRAQEPGRELRNSRFEIPSFLRRLCKVVGGTSSRAAAPCSP